MNTHKYLKPYAIVPVTMDAIRDLVELGKQQADRIAELEKNLHMIQRHYDQLDTQTKQSEPVAWIYQDNDTLQPALKFANPTKYWATVISTPDIPLYTTPQTKPLSEKELYEVFDKCYPNNGDGDVVTLVDFARAIEERHGIK